MQSGPHNAAEWTVQEIREMIYNLLSGKSKQQKVYTVWLLFFFWWVFLCIFQNVYNKQVFLL